MKVNTDGVLLGAWVTINQPTSILDVGTGTGVIALMLAQRSEATITAIEIEENAASEAVQNVLNSPWNTRVSVLPADFRDYSKNSPGKFDLIVSNPPFFSNSSKSLGLNKSLARHNHALPFDLLIEGAKNLLEPNGLLALILPVEEAVIFIQLAEKARLFLTRKTEVQPSITKKVNRVLMEFSHTKTDTETGNLIIYAASGSDYTEQYKLLTRDFYLNF